LFIGLEHAGPAFGVKDRILGPGVCVLKAFVFYIITINNIKWADSRYNLSGSNHHFDPVTILFFYQYTGLLGHVQSATKATDLDILLSKIY